MQSHLERSFRDHFEIICRFPGSVIDFEVFPMFISQIEIILSRIFKVPLANKKETI